MSVCDYYFIKCESLLRARNLALSIVVSVSFANLKCETRCTRAIGHDVEPEHWSQIILEHAKERREKKRHKHLNKIPDHFYHGPNY